jgi:endonuclease/exonuclease/phosphatase family metal-dependent hydrolase
MFLKIIKVLNILSLAALLLSCISAYVDPHVFWQLAFMGFVFPAALFINFCFVFIWLVLRKPFGIITMVAIVLTWKFIHSTFAFNFFSAQTESGIKLMTWNVRNFDLYNWNHNMDTRKKMLQLIRKENPDVLCFQEFYSNNQFFHNIEYFRDTLGYKYCYFPPAVELIKTPQTKLQKTLWRSGRLDQQWGVATFSKFPITDTGRINFNATFANSCIYTDIDAKGKKVRLYNVHFQSIHLGYEDYATLDELVQTQNTRWNSLKSILRKMKLAYSKRSLQANMVAETMAAYKGNKILCGDFNDIPVSYTYNTVSNGLQDAFIEKAKGFGGTFVNKLNFFRIDYTLFGTGTQINSYKIIRKDLSDHYPVCVSFKLD